MQSRKEAIEQTGHITDVKTHAPVQTDPNQKMKLVPMSGTQAHDAVKNTGGGNGIARAPQTGTSKANND